MSRASRHQRGIAIVMAMLIVALATSVAAFAAWQQNLWLRQSESLNSQALALAASRTAISLGREVLADDAKKNQVDHLGEAWATYELVTPADGGGTVSGKLIEQQGLFNLNNVGAENSTDQTLAQSWFESLLTSLNIPKPHELAEALKDYIDEDPSGQFEDLNYLGKTIPYRTADTPLRSVDELYRIEGFDANIIKKLRPFVTAIPVVNTGPVAPGKKAFSILMTPINVNTANPEVLNAVFGQAGADIVTQRESKFFQDQADFDTRIGPKLAPADPNNPLIHPWTFAGAPPPASPSPTGAPPASANIDIKSDYFVVSASSQFDRTEFSVKAMIKREQQGVVPPTTIVWQQQQ